MKFDLIEKEQVKLGMPFNVTMKIENDSDEERTIKITLTSSVVFYTGVPAGTIKTEKYTVNAGAKAGTNFYYCRVKAACMLQEC